MKVRLTELNRAITETGANSVRHNRSLKVEGCGSFAGGGTTNQIVQIRTLHAWPIRQNAHQAGSLIEVKARVSSTAQINPPRAAWEPGTFGKSSETATSAAK